VKQSDRIATAYHEAGHALVAWLLGIRLRRVTIVPSKKDNFDGCCYHAKIVRGKHPEFDDSPGAFVRMQKHVMVCLAGIISQRRFNSRTVRRWDASGDYRLIFPIVSNRLSSDKETTAYLSWLEVKTDELLRQPHNWARVKLLARELLARNTLKRNEVDDLLFVK
jgi:hypothetical protein